MLKTGLSGILVSLLVCFASHTQAWVENRNLRYVHEGFADLWLIEKYECRGQCDTTVLDMLEKGKKVPQSFSDSTRRFQYDFFECNDPTFAHEKIIPWVDTVSLEEGVKRANHIMEPRWKRSAKDWWFERPVVNEGYLGCFMLDGNFHNAFVVIDIQPDYMIAYVLGNYLVKYRPVSEQNKAGLESHIAQSARAEFP